jgi:hypothetical protein
MAARNRKAEFKYTLDFIGTLFAEDMHAKRVYSLANATLGVIQHHWTWIGFGAGTIEQTCD